MKVQTETRPAVTVELPGLDPTQWDQTLPSYWANKGWCQKPFAVSADGHWVYPADEATMKTGVQWCAWGSMVASGRTCGGSNYNSEQDPISKLLGPDAPSIRWNGKPGRTQQEVVAALVQFEAKMGWR